MVVARRLVTFFIFRRGGYFIAGSGFLRFSAGSFGAGLPLASSWSAGSEATGGCSGDYGKSMVGGT
jgi:hypothetical protein